MNAATLPAVALADQPQVGLEACPGWAYMLACLSSLAATSMAMPVAPGAGQSSRSSTGNIRPENMKLHDVEVALVDVERVERADRSASAAPGATSPASP